MSDNGPKQQHEYTSEWSEGGTWPPAPTTPTQATITRKRLTFRLAPWFFVITSLSSGCYASWSVIWCHYHTDSPTPWIWLPFSIAVFGVPAWCLGKLIDKAVDMQAIRLPQENGWEMGAQVSPSEGATGSGSRIPHGWPAARVLVVTAIFLATAQNVWESVLRSFRIPDFQFDWGWLLESVCYVGVTAWAIGKVIERELARRR